MMKALILSLCILFANNIYYSLHYFNSFDEIANQYTLIYQNEMSVFDQSQYSYNDLLYELNEAPVSHTSAFMPVISDHILLNNEGGERKDNLRLSFHDNMNDIDDFVANNRKLILGHLPQHANECIISLELLEKNDYQLGETITFLNSLDWNIRFDLQIVGVYQDLTLPLDPNYQYTSRRNEVITLYETIVSSPIKELVQSSNNVSHLFLTNQEVYSPHSVQASEFYRYFLKYLSLYLQFSTLLIAICMLSFFIIHYFENSLMTYFYDKINKVNHYIKRPFKNRWLFLYLLICCLIFIVIILQYRYFNRSLIYYILNIMNGFTHNSHGFPIPDTLKNYYIQQGETSVFYPVFIILFILWLGIRYLRLSKYIQQLSIKNTTHTTNESSKIILFSSKNDLDEYFRNTTHCVLSSKFNEPPFFMKLIFGFNSPSNLTECLKQQLESAQEYHKVVVIFNDEIDYLQYKEVFDNYSFTYYICTKKILPIKSMSVYGYYQNKLIEVLKKDTVC